jgi:hypothetical protein
MKVLLSRTSVSSRAYRREVSIRRPSVPTGVSGEEEYRSEQTAGCCFFEANTCESVDYIVSWFFLWMLRVSTLQLLPSRGCMVVVQAGVADPRSNLAISSGAAACRSML